MVLSITVPYMSVNYGLADLYFKDCLDTGASPFHGYLNEETKKLH